MAQKEKLSIPYPVVVEGKYDKIRLSNILDAQIIVTDGFGIFRKEEKRLLLRRLAAERPLIVLTDSDGGGKIIRSHLSGMLPRDRIIPLYIPQIKGKERRKDKPSAAGTLGVEGMEDSLLYELFLPYAGDGNDPLTRSRENPLSKVDFFEDGLTGGANSTAKRDELARRVGLPAGMSANALLEALRLILSYEEYLELVGRGGETEQDEG
jgi:ribonuclease M5